MDKKMYAKVLLQRELRCCRFAHERMANILVTGEMLIKTTINIAYCLPRMATAGEHYWQGPEWLKM